MGLASGAQGKKDLNFELNLLPVFDVLSVCICFLLMTVVWIEVRSLETKQTMGSESIEKLEPGSSLWIAVDEKNNLKISLKSKNSNSQFFSVKSNQGVLDFKKIAATVEKITGGKSGGMSLVAQVLPAKNTKYNQVIQIMDCLKSLGIKDIGLSPI